MGNPEGGRQAAATNIKRYGRDFYTRLGKMGGKAPHSKPRGFAAHPELASEAGRLGGSRSRRGSQTD